MSSFDVANWIAMSICLIALICISYRRMVLSDLFFFLGISSIMALLSIWSSRIVTLNLTLLLLSLYLMFHPRRLARTKSELSWGPSSLGIIFLTVLFLVPIILSNSAGWLIIVGVASKYWFLFTVSLLYSFTKNIRIRLWIIVSALSAALFWQFKLALVLFTMMLMHYFTTTKSLKWRIIILISIALIPGVIFYFQSSQLMLFLEQSVFRPDYDYDTKILGFSDGARLIIWTHYLENSVWLGKGEYYLSDIIPTHNIFVYLTHELGIVGLLCVGPIFVFLLIRMIKHVGIVFASLVIGSLNLSSIGEYPSMWIFCFVIAPIIVSSSFAKKRITLASSSTRDRYILRVEKDELQ